MTVSRANAMTAEVREKFFEMWREVIEENNLQDAPHRIFNLDETGMVIE